jgi:hypothetical protein
MLSAFSGVIVASGVGNVAFKTFNEFISSMLKLSMHALFVSSCIFCVTVICKGVCVVVLVRQGCPICPGIDPQGRLPAGPCIPNILAARFRSLPLFLNVSRRCAIAQNSSKY